MKRIYSLALSLALSVGALGMTMGPHRVEALSIDISKDQGGDAPTPAPSNPPANNPAPANHSNHAGAHQTEIYTKLERIFYRNGVVNFNYAFSNFGQYGATINSVRYEGVLSLNQNYYKFSATGTLNNCYVAPGQTVRYILAFKDARYGNYEGNLGSQGKSSTNWTTH